MGMQIDTVAGEGLEPPLLPHLGVYGLALRVPLPLILNPANPPNIKHYQIIIQLLYKATYWEYLILGGAGGWLILGGWGLIGNCGGEN